MVPLRQLIGKVSANMILPYPPGIPVLIPGERITEQSRTILEFIFLLCDIGVEFPGFETAIHGVFKMDDGEFGAKVLIAP